MNFFSGQPISWESLQFVVFESAKIVLLTGLTVALVKSQAWKRNLWQGAVLALITLCLVEYFGVSTWITTQFQQAG